MAGYQYGGLRPHHPSEHVRNPNALVSHMHEVSTKQGCVKGESSLFFDHCVNAIAAITILSVTYGWELLYRIVLVETAQNTVAKYLPCNNATICVI